MTMGFCFGSIRSRTALGTMSLQPLSLFSIVELVASVAELVASLVEFLASMVEFLASMVEFVASVVEFVYSKVELVASEVELVAIADCAVSRPTIKANGNFILIASQLTRM